MTADERHYPLGDDSHELARLGLQHRVWTEVTHAAWRRGNFHFGDTIADLGCGPGYCTLELAQLVGDGGEVIAVDQSARFLDMLRRRADSEGIGNIRPVHCRVADLALADRSLDGAFARWLLCFVPDPGALIAHVARALKPGATLVTLDYFNYRAFRLAPGSPALDEIVAGLERAVQNAGGDVDIQGQVPGFMARAGLRVTQVRHIGDIARPGTPGWHAMERFLLGQIPALLEHGHVSTQVVDSFWRDWTAHAARPEAFLYPPPVLEIHGTRP